LTRNWSGKGTSSIEGDVLCTSNPAGPRACRAVFRNPSGTFEQKNEYIYFRHLRSAFGLKAAMAGAGMALRLLTLVV
jgi:hypothetical protein